MIDWLTEPWQHTFMQHAFLAIVMVGVICGTIGSFVILRGLAFMGDALAHAIFPGVVISFILGTNFLIGALVASVIVSFMIGGVSQGGRLNNDTAIGVLFAGGFALGVAIMSTQKSYTRDLNSFLFGSILSVTREDLYLTAAIGLVVLVVVYWFRREFTMIAFDRTFARASGIRIWAYDQLFLLLIALAIVISLQTVGNILVLAMLVTPPATARLLTDRLLRMMVIGSALGALCGIAGLYLSWYQGVPSGAGVVLIETAVFGVVFLFNPRSGLLTMPLRHRLHREHPERDVLAEA